MQKYLYYMIIGVKEQIFYKGAFVAKLFSKIVYLYLQLSIWNALFSTGSQIDSALSREETICYVTVATIISSFMECNTIEWVNNQIRTGNISIELIRPIRYRVMLFSRHLGSSILKLALFTLPLCVIVKVFVKEVYLCDAQIVLGLVSVVFAFFIQFLYSLLIGLLAFWLIVTWPINMFLDAIYKLLSGMWIPVTLFPTFLKKVSMFLPFSAIYSIPVNTLTSSMSQIALLSKLGVQVVWIVILIVLNEIIWIVGNRKLVVQGG